MLFILFPKELRHTCLCCLPSFSACPSLTTLEDVIQVQANLAGKVSRSFVEIGGWTILEPLLRGKQLWSILRGSSQLAYQQKHRHKSIGNMSHFSGNNLHYASVFTENALEQWPNWQKAVCVGTHEVSFLKYRWIMWWIWITEKMRRCWTINVAVNL